MILIDIAQPGAALDRKGRGFIGFCPFCVSYVYFMDGHPLRQVSLCAKMRR